MQNTQNTQNEQTAQTSTNTAEELQDTSLDEFPEYIDDYIEYSSPREYDDFRYSSRSPRMHYEEASKQHIFVTELYGENGFEEYYIYTDVDITYKVKHGSYSSQAESPDDYYDTYHVVAWNVSAVFDDAGVDVNPKNFLTEDEYKRYTASLEEFVEDF